PYGQVPPDAVRSAAPSNGLPEPSPDPQAAQSDAQYRSSAAPQAGVGYPGLPIQGVPITFELLGFSPSKSSVQLKVLLKNGQDTPFQLPSNLKAIVKNEGKPDLTVKPSFQGSSIPPHGELAGVVNVPAKQLSPASDMVLTDIMPPESGQRDLHLVARVSTL